MKIKQLITRFGILLFFGLGMLNPAGAEKSLLENLLESDPSMEDEPLHVDEAFKFSNLPPKATEMLLRWDIADKHYLYRHTFKFALEDDKDISLGEAVIPPGKPKTDQFFGDIEVYYKGLDISLPFNRKTAAGVNTTLKVTYQGCAERGICYPPETKKIALNLAPSAPNTDSIVTEADNALEQKAQSQTADRQLLSEQEQIAFDMQNKGFLGTILFFLLAGIGLAFTPCVFPMIPILSGIIVGQGAKITARKAFIMSLVYVLSMSVVFAVAGVIAGFTGESVQAALQKPWVIASFSLIFVALALSMFGFYELQVPASIQGKLANISNKQKSGSLLGVGIMGGLSALIVGACVTPILIGSILYIGKTGDAILGGISLFALGLGMGLPLIVIGTLGGKLMPQKGGWMDVVKYVFGVMLLGLAVWLADPILDNRITILLVAVLVIVSGIYMGAFEQIPEGHSSWHKLWKGLGLIMIVYGVLLMIGLGTGQGSLIKPLKGLSLSPATAKTEHLEFIKIKSYEDLEDKLGLAQNSGQPVMLDFYADWCVACKEMEAFTFSDPGVQKTLQGVMLLQADVTANDDIDKNLMKKLGIIGPPAILFFNKGQEIKAYRLVGFKAATEFSAHVTKAIQ